MVDASRMVRSLSEAVMVETYVGENSEGLVGRIRVSRLKDSLRVVGNRGTPRLTAERRNVLFVGVALILVGFVMQALRLPAASVLVFGGVTGAIFALFIGPADRFVRHYDATCSRMLEVENVGVVKGAVVGANPYRVAFEAVDRKGRASQFVLNPESPEQVAKLLAILAP